jgi:hypothetical protein
MSSGAMGCLTGNKPRSTASSSCAGYLGYPFPKNTSIMVLSVPFLGIIMPDWQERDFLFDCLFPNIGTNILSSLHTDQ